MELRDQTRESVHLAVLEGMEAVIIDTEDSYFFVRAVNVPGQHLPAHTISTGKVLLAYQWETRLHEILHQTTLTRYTSSTITDPRLLLEELRLVRQRGYAISQSELEEGIDAVAAPIFDHLGAIVAAVSIGGPSERCSSYTDCRSDPLACSFARRLQSSAVSLLRSTGRGASIASTAKTPRVFRERGSTLRPAASSACI